MFSSKFSSSKFYALFGARLLLTLLLYFLLPQILKADTLHLLDGKKIQGKFLGIQDGNYKFKIKDGEILYIPEEQVNDLQTQALEVAQSQKDPLETKERQEKEESTKPSDSSSRYTLLNRWEKDSR